jgi:NADH dehydrogenase
VTELALDLEARYGFAPEERRFVRGDILDPDVLAQAIEGAESIIHLAGHAPGTAKHVDGREEACMAALVGAARTRPIDRFIYLSATSADPQVSVPWLRAKGRAEQLLVGSGLPYVILRCGIVGGEASPILRALAEAVHSHDALRLPLLCRGSLRVISVGDVAIALATGLDHARMAGKVIDLGGPDSVTLAQLLQLIAHRMRREVAVHHRPFQATAIKAAIRARLPHAADLIRWFAVSEAPDVGRYDALIPMRRKPLAEELRDYPWGMAPPRPGEALPVFQPENTGLPAFIPGPHLREGANPADRPAASYGRVDPFGNVEKEDPDEAPGSKS